MAQALRIGIVGDYDPGRISHVATDAAIGHAGDALALAVDVAWLPTPSLEGDGIEDALAPYDGLWCAPGSPYASMGGALRAIQFARERDWPFTGT